MIPRSLPRTNQIGSGADVASSVVGYLMLQPTVTSLLGTWPDYGPFIFSDDLLVDPSPNAAIVVQHRGGWRTASPYSSLIFPRVEVQIYAPTAEQTWSVFRAVDTQLHRPTGMTEMFDNLVVYGSIRIEEFGLERVPDAPQDHLLYRGHVRYGLVVG